MIRFCTGRVIKSERKKGPKHCPRPPIPNPRHKSIPPSDGMPGIGISFGLLGDIRLRCDQQPRKSRPRSATGLAALTVRVFSVPEVMVDRSEMNCRRVFERCDDRTVAPIAEQACYRSLRSQSPSRSRAIATARPPRTAATDHPIPPGLPSHAPQIAAGRHRGIGAGDPADDGVRGFWGVLARGVGTAAGRGQRAEPV